ncbi:MAG: hypothetical protein U0441_29645 [Polyangiaceae bacterium]
MRRWSRGMVGAALALMAASAFGVFAGCENTAGDCNLTAECGGPGGGAECDPNKADGPVDEACGVFVSPAAKPGGTGTRAAPFATFAEALTAVKKSATPRIYACSGAFAEALDLPAGLTLYGGLDCAKSWAHTDDGRTAIAPASGVPLTFRAGATIHVENLHVTAPDGAAPDGTGDDPRSGGASIGAVALPSADIEIVRSEIQAGKGADGAPASELPVLGASAQGLNGEDACGPTGLGGAVATVLCPDPAQQGHEIDASGGRGGDGAPVGTDATAGTGPLGGAPGAVQPDGGICVAGTMGGTGTDGAEGTGGQSTAALLTSEYKGYPGTDGSPGHAGSGGGGGGGGKACMAGHGAGGGGGGGGGCGGFGGGGGGAGGSSIALWAPGASVYLSQASLIAGVAGQGASGAAGQKGGLGGAGGHGGVVVEASEACSGGPGGPGGAGGPGGGGQGGHSIALVWQSAAPKLVDSTLTVGTAGQGAAGGPGSTAAATGASGIACQSMDASKPECASM